MDRLLVALESRREDLYVQFFDPDGDRRSASRRRCSPELFRELGRATARPACVVAGDAAERPPRRWPAAPDIEVLPETAPDARGVLAAALRSAARGTAEVPAPALSSSARRQPSESGRGSDPRHRAAAARRGRPISLLHGACFPDDPWDAGAIEQIIAIPGFFGWLAWEDERPVGFALVRAWRGSEILSLGVLPPSPVRHRLGYLMRVCDEPDGAAPNASCSKWPPKQRSGARFMPGEVLRGRSERPLLPPAGRPRRCADIACAPQRSNPELRGYCNMSRSFLRFATDG